MARPDRRGRRTAMLLAAASLLPSAGQAAGLAAGQPHAVGGPPRDWPARLEARLERLERSHGVRFGAHVRDLDSGRVASHRGDEHWYLASMVKLPVAVAVLQGVERGAWTLDTPLTLRHADQVDGAGPTNYRTVGTPIPLRSLIEPMMIHSDNTASDMLIDLVGIDTVNALVQSVAPGGFGRLTSLVEVRRQVYAQLAPQALRLEGPDFLQLRVQPGDTERLDWLARKLELPRSAFLLPDLSHAYEAYYAGGLNAGRLAAFGEFVAALADGRLLEPAGTDWLLATMARSLTGARRLKAGLPSSVRWAHKTGTQRGRTCDGGLVTEAGGGRRLVVVACTRGEATLAQAESTLKAVGEAIVQVGLLAPGPAPGSPPGAAP